MLTQPFEVVEGGSDDGRKLNKFVTSHSYVVWKQDTHTIWWMNAFITGVTLMTRWYDYTGWQSMFLSSMYTGGTSRTGDFVCFLFNYQWQDIFAVSRFGVLRLVFCFFLRDSWYAQFLIDTNKRWFDQTQENTDAWGGYLYWIFVSTGERVQS